MNKLDKIKELKKSHPTLNKGVNDEVVKLDADEYAETIARWADAELAQEAEIAKAEADASAKSALLDKLGITADEAKLLLA